MLDFDILWVLHVATDSASIGHSVDSTVHYNKSPNALTLEAKPVWGKGATIE